MIAWVRFVPSLVVSGMLSAVILWVAFNVWFALNENYRNVLTPLVVPASNWQVVEGQGHVSDSLFWLESPGNRGYTLAVGALRDAIRYQSLDRIVVHFGQVGDYNELSVGIATSSSMANTAEAPLRFEGSSTGRVKAADLLFPDGDVGVVTIRVRGLLESPLGIDRLELHRSKPDFVELQRLLLTSLLDLSDWTQRSINHSRPDYVPLKVSPVVATVLWSGQFVLLAVFLVNPKAPLIRRVGVVVIWGTLAGWLMLDSGWQLSLWIRHVDAVSKYSAGGGEHRAIDELDAEVAKFIRKLREVIDDDDQPVVIFADSAFEYMRARYAAVPQPVVGREGADPRWLRRIRSGDVLVALDLRNPIRERAVVLENAGWAGEPRDLPLELVAGRHAELVDCPEPARDCSGKVLRLKPDEFPWLVEVPWMDNLGDGVWQARFDLYSGSRPGWVRLELFRRVEGGSGSKRWGSREIYLDRGQQRLLSLAFRSNEGAEYRLRIREMNGQGASVNTARLVPRFAGNDLVELSIDGRPPYYLSRRILESGGAAAWEML